MGLIGSVRCEKSWSEFVARTFALIAPVQYVLHQVSCSYEMIPNVPKYYETHRSISLGSNGVDWVGPFCTKFHPVTKRSQMHPNTMKQIETLVLGPMGWIGCVCCEKSRRDFVPQTFALIAPVHPVLHRVSCSYETIPNAHNHYETHQNMRFGSNGVDQVHSLWKITTWLPGTYFCINWTSQYV